MTHAMHDFLISLGCRKSGTDYILDEIDHEFFLLFDCAEDTDNLESQHTCDILIAAIGSSLNDNDWKAKSICVVADCFRSQVIRFLVAIGPNRFSYQARAAMDEWSNP